MCYITKHTHPKLSRAWPGIEIPKIVWLKVLQTFPDLYGFE